MEESNTLGINEILKIVSWIVLTIIMIGAFILIYSLQNWVTPILFLFPLLTITYCIFLGVFWWIRTRSMQSFPWLQFSPFGDESPLVYCFIFSGLLQLVTLFFIGWDAQIHPHLMDNYGTLYLLALILCFSIPLLWITGKIILSSRIQFQTTSISLLLPFKSHTPLFLGLYAISFLIPLGLTIVDSLMQFNSGGIRSIWLWRIPLAHTQAYTLNGSGFLLLLFGFNILGFTLQVIWILFFLRNQLIHMLSEVSLESKQQENSIRKKVLHSLIGK